MSDFTMRTQQPIGLMTITGNKGATYLILRGYSGDYHVFVEVQAKEAALDCGEVEQPTDNTRTLWDRLWQRHSAAAIA